MNEKIEEFLKDKWRYAYTYNQVAEAIGHKLTKANARDFKLTLDKMVESKESGVVIAGKSKTSASDKKRHSLYQWSDIRKKYDAMRNPAQRDHWVQTVILDYVTSKPNATSRDIYQAVRDGFCTLSQAIISRNLLALVDNGKIVTEPGSRRAVLHVAAPKYN